MTGGNIAYHLRPNKAVERALFLDLLNRIGRTSFNISSYQYVGLGGPFMEDFKALHLATRISDMTCIERDAIVQARQRFNCPLSCVKFVLSDSSTFLDNFRAETPTVAWLDFTSPGELKQQLDDTFKLVKNLAHGDIFKVTLNASVAALREDPGNIKQHELASLRRQAFEERVGLDKPSTINPEDFKANKYPTLLLQALHNAAKRAVNNTSLDVQPLTAFSYSDGTIMLTATGIILDPNEACTDEFPVSSRLSHWPFAMLDWKYPIDIDLPVLSLRERMELEKIQPNGSVQDAKNTLGQVINPAGIPPQAVTSFAKFYRIYPEFVRANL
ncbi:O-methyltransferase [Pollutimonas thiosulfatoxidans]|uniref:Uncharacterized protein n=1 Tax=Pollutimonas thiosulfatoxidans TaxID=2028345 RepID=A0A410G8C1_9BURK|nr:O-methyltransferase [Pollutimonas thiosulfatoxidans]QAA92455.1 hypothetical protein CKA81_00260 [Pollutimonas thiosulfatoxidans]